MLALFGIIAFCCTPLGRLAVLGVLWVFFETPIGLLLLLLIIKSSS